VVRNFHANLAKKAKLAAAVFLNPNPPNFFGQQILSHAISGSPLLLLEFFQKNSRLILSNFSETLAGS